LQIGLIEEVHVPHLRKSDMNSNFYTVAAEMDWIHQKCDDINKTLVVAKIQDSEQIVGGYNPHNWNELVAKRSSESFIFNFHNRNDVNTAKLSYVVTETSCEYDHAIYCGRCQLPAFGSNDL